MNQSSLKPLSNFIYSAENRLQSVGSIDINVLLSTKKKISTRQNERALEAHLKQCH